MDKFREIKSSDKYSILLIFFNPGKMTKAIPLDEGSMQLFWGSRPWSMKACYVALCMNPYDPSTIFAYPKIISSQLLSLDFRLKVGFFKKFFSNCHWFGSKLTVYRDREHRLKFWLLPLFLFWLSEWLLVCHLTSLKLAFLLWRVAVLHNHFRGVSED